MNTDYLKYLQIIKKYSPLEIQKVELSFELNYEYQVLTIFNTLYEIGYTDFTGIKFEFVENVDGTKIYRCFGTVKTHMSFQEINDFLNWRKEFLITKQTLDDSWTNNVSKPKPKIIPHSKKINNIIKIYAIIGTILIVFSLLGIIINSNNKDNNADLITNFFYSSYPTLFLGILCWFVVSIYLLVRNDTVHIFHRSRIRGNKFVVTSSDLPDIGKNNVNMNRIKEKYDKLKEQMPSWYCAEAFKFYYRDVYLLDKKIFDF